MMNEQDFNQLLEQAFEEKAPDYHGQINIAVVGKVSAGKSSLINALLDCPRSAPLASVGAESGVTQSINPYRLGNEVLIIDCPGLDDVRQINSQETQDFLKHIDIGIMVVTGSADASQRSRFADLQQHAQQVFVVLNKIDEWDDLEPSALADVAQQWADALDVPMVYRTACKGFDPRMRQDAPMDVRGVDALRDDVDEFLRSHRKDLLLAKHLRSKQRAAKRIINAALSSVSVEAMLPAAGVTITATQITAIASLHYLYTGKVMSRSSALQILPAFAGKSLGRTAFLWVKSFLPPTGVLDIAAVGIAVSVTYGMLNAVKWMLENDYTLDDMSMLTEQYQHFLGEYRQQEASQSA